ncbi:hypothetical protein BGX38DRAFT_1242725 [Terfezia claveryi]|nr:hypothetical protein BGX38DRAFT_1242725 [Terfezia claveryi]
MHKSILTSLPSVLLLPTSVNPRLAGICSLKHACADLSHQRAQICLRTNQHIFPGRVNRHISRAARTNRTREHPASMHSRDIPHLYAQT